MMYVLDSVCVFFFFFQAEDGIRDLTVTGVQTCALPISLFFELFFLGRSESRRCAQRFAVIVERQIAHVQRDGAGRRLLVDRSEERRVGKECRSRWSPYH